MKFAEFKKAGHWPTLLAAFLYFDISFMAWVALGPLMVYIAHDMNLAVSEKFTLVAIPVLAVARLRGKGAYSTLPASLLPETFSFEELLDAYRIALGAPTLDAASFRRRVEELSMLEPMGAGADGTTLYRLTPGAMLFDRRI